MEGEIGNLVDWCTDHDTLRHLHEMHQFQVPEPQPATPRTHVYPYVAETPPHPYYDTTTDSTMPSAHTSEEPNFFGLCNQQYPINFEYNACSNAWARVDAEDEEPYVGTQSDPIRLSSSIELSLEYVMPSDEWYDNPAVVDVEDEETVGNSRVVNGTENFFDFSDLMRSIDNDSDYTPRPFILRDTATSVLALLMGRFNGWIPGRFREMKQKMKQLEE